MNPYEKGMQKSMTEALSIPHFYLMEELDLTNLTQIRNELKKQDIKLTFMPFFIKAFSMALTEFPKMNSIYDSENPYSYTMVENHNISMAIDSPSGLVVPNIKNCQNLSIIEIQEEMLRLRDLA